MAFFLTQSEVDRSVLSGALFNAHTVIFSGEDGAFQVLAVPEESILARILNGDIAALGVDDLQSVTHHLPLVVSANTMLAAQPGPQSILVDSTVPISITLPAASDDDLCEYQIENINSGAVTIVPDGSDTMNGLGGNQILSQPFSNLILVTDGVSNWISPIFVTPS